MAATAPELDLWLEDDLHERSGVRSRDANAPTARVRQRDRFLYADSEPFPLGFDFLATFRALVVASAEVFRLAYERDGYLARREARDEATSRDLEEVRDFVRKVGQRVVVAQSHTSSIVAPYAERVEALLTSIDEDARRQLQARLQGEHGAIDERLGDVKRRMNEALQGFFVHTRLPVERTHMKADLVDGKYAIAAQQEIAGGIVAAFRLAPSDLLDHPARLSDLIDGHIEVRTGYRSGWFRKMPAPRLERIEGRFVGRLELAPDRAELALRRRADVPDDLVIRFAREEGSLQIILHGGEDEPPVEVEGEELNTLSRLWDALEEVARDRADARQSLIGLQCEGEEALTAGRHEEVLTRLLDVCRPFVQEIAERSPSPRELSLKRENPDGRREELYLRRAELSHALAGVDPERITRFDGLSILPNT